ncbi:hypothetical protein GCM10007425_30290 [Lysinibacillus alkalisoli]|uniref:WD40 repeat domain-containing protein n=1 Tax=Lysinibacillus alkalisoli TaxID=1911548 RepID=A0A917GAD7_9BACI|nr:WD40 repeat domain-containing protein [Lysinibacillus alkalisoli]GGG33537.1 hypothetical protein GCM10007425_30290 [Lysinibacillus alkalisoli]
MSNENGLFTKHRGPVTGVAHIPNSNAVITSGYDSAIGWFNIDTKEVKLIGYHDHLANTVIVNNLGTKGASCSADYSIKIWDLKTLTLQKTLLGHSDDVESFVFIDDKTAASASRDQRILVWNLETGAILRVIEGHEKDVLSLAYYDGKLYSSGDDKTLRVWDLQTGKLVYMWGPFDVETDTCAIDLKNERVILGCDDGYIRIFNIINGDLIKEIPGHASGIKKVAVSPSNGDILSSAYDQKILIWDSKSLELKTSLQQNPVKWERSLDFSTDGKKVFAGTFDGTVLYWDAKTGELINGVGIQEEHKGNPCFNDVATNAKGEIALVSDDGYVRLTKLNDLNDFSVYEPSSGRFLMNGLAMNQQYELVVGGAHNQRIHIFKNEDGQLNKSIDVFLGEGPVNTIRISDHPNYERESFVGCYSGTIVRVSHTGEIIEKMSIHGGAVKALRLHPNKSMGVSCSAEGELLSWDFYGNKLRKYLGHSAIINDVDISPSGKLIASVSRDFSIKFYDFETGDLLHSYTLGKKSLKSVCFYNDTTVIVGDYWGNVISVELSEGIIARNKIASNGISSISNLDDFVIAVSYDGSVNVINPINLSIEKRSNAMNQRIEELLIY